MDFLSLSPSDDDIFGGIPYHQHRDSLLQGPPAQAAISPAVSVPETPPSVLRAQQRRKGTSTSTVSSTIHILPGSSLLDLQNYNSSEDSSTPPDRPPPPAKRGRGRPALRVSSGRRGHSSPSPARMTATPVAMSLRSAEVPHQPTILQDIGLDSSLPPKGTEG